jgi:hypothetical protein
MILSQSEIAKLDKLLSYLYENRKYSPRHDSDVSKHMGISVEESAYLRRTLIEFSEQEECLGRLMEASSPNRFLKLEYEAERFIKNGGFKSYFKKKNKSQKSPIMELIYKYWWALIVPLAVGLMTNSILQAK